ncbi:MAG: enoyl-CoA hydratase-related protein [Myxococcota bacterium]
MSEHIQTEIVERVSRSVISRPDKKNALTGAMYGALTAALAAGEANADVRVHYITGVPGIFTAGNDMASFLDPTGGFQKVLGFLDAIQKAEKPLIVAVTGIAVGVGVTMLLHADLVYAARSATFRTPFVDLGVVPEAGSSLLMPQIMGYPRAARMLLLGERFSAQEAFQSGLISQIFEDDALETEAFQRAIRLSQRAPEAVRLSKSLMKRHHKDLVEQTMKTESALFFERLKSPELREAVSAFLEKRPADFSNLDG